MNILFVNSATNLSLDLVGQVLPLEGVRVQETVCPLGALHNLDGGRQPAVHAARAGRRRDRSRGGSGGCSRRCGGRGGCGGRGSAGGPRFVGVIGRGVARPATELGRRLRSEKKT